VGRNVFVSAYKHALPFGDLVLARAEQSPDLVQLDSALLLAIVLDELLNYYDHLCEQVEDEIEQMEQRALCDTSDAFLTDLLQVKRYVFGLNRLVAQLRPVFAAFLRPDFRFVSGGEVATYYTALEERFERLSAVIEADKENVNGAFDIYVSHMAHRTNGIMKVLTMVSTVLLPISVILGVFGTSFKDVGLYEAQNLWIMAGLMAVTVLVVLVLFWRRGWFS
jgi:magnesium transporter